MKRTLRSNFRHLDGVAAELKKAIRAAGALPFEIRTVAPSEPRRTSTSRP